MISTGYRCSPQDIGVLHRISSTGYVLHRIYFMFPTGYVIHRITPTAVLHCDYLLFPTAVPHRICPPQDIRSCGEHLPCSPQWFSTGYICPPQLFSTGYIAIYPVENGCGAQSYILWRTISCGEHHVIPMWSHSTRHSAATTLQQEVHERRLGTSTQLAARPEKRQRTSSEG